MNNKPTKRQHYIPQVYLRGFSPDYLSKKKNNLDESKFRIFTYDLNKTEQIEKAIPIKDVCFENYLYEIKDENGDIIYVNHLEKWLNKMESRFSKYRRQLEQKVLDKKNINNALFFQEDEILFWKRFFVVQSLRIPQIMRIAESVAKDVFRDKLSDNQAKTVSKIWCLPFLRELNGDEPELDVFNRLLKPLDDMIITVGYDDKATIITSDMPFSIYGDVDNDAFIKYDKIMVPITSQICLFLINKNNYNSIRENYLFEVNDDIRREIFLNVSLMAFEKIYLNHMITGEEIELLNVIHEARDRSLSERFL